MLYKQGSDLKDLRLTWREIENGIFSVIFEEFGEILEYFLRFLWNFEGIGSL